MYIYLRKDVNVFLIVEKRKDIKVSLLHHVKGATVGFNLIRTLQYFIIKHL